MLAPKTQDTPYIGVFKLGSGEEFIAKVVEETMIAYKVEAPLCVVPNGQGQMGFAPLLFLADKTKPISIPKPVIHAPAAEELKTQYESMTTGIALPKKAGIIS